MIRGAPRRLAALTILAVCMAGFGLGVWRLLGALQTRYPTGVRPDQSHALVDLPGTVFLAQGGVLYRLHNQSFRAITGFGGRWTQPTPVPGAPTLVAVTQTINFSNLVEMAANGGARRLLTHNAAPAQANNHWAFYPAVAPGGRTVFYAYDLHDPNASYNVTFAIMSQPLAGGAPTQWTTPNPYTGGDVQPVPLPSGGLLYSKFAITNGATYAQLWLQSGPGQAGSPLTPATADCQEPALSPSGRELAMICVNARTQHDTLEVAPFTGHGIGPRTIVPAGPLAASPTWSPSGRQLLYLAPSGKLGPFQLWWLRNPLARHPAAPAQVTTGLDLTATSAVTWR